MENDNNKNVFYHNPLSLLCLWGCDPVNRQWMDSGMSGPAGVLAQSPVLMGLCREPGSATTPRMEALSAGDSIWRLWTASLESVLV